MTKALRIIAWTVTALFLIGMALPLAVDRMLVSSENWKSYWVSYLLTDQDGQRHVGFLALGRIVLESDILEYGYEPKPGTDLSKWRKQILGLPRDQIANIDGFVWSDKGFLWTDNQHMGRIQIVEGSRLGLSRPVAPDEQTELTLDGAPWDAKTPLLSLFGKFPTFRLEQEDDNVKLDLTLTATMPRWYQYNDGRPFKVGDFGLGSMNETAGEITGVITHKKTGQTFQVKGVGLMEDAIGVPWSWLEWGAHDWNDIHFPGGWSGSLWKAQDDWQWGYHRNPNIGWLWDPQLQKYHTFQRVDIREVEYVTDDTSGLEYPRRAVWRAIGDDATLEIENTNLTFKPRESRLPVVGIAIPMSYGTNTVKGRLLRRDGTSVDLGTGIGTMEHFGRVIPDYVFWGPCLLVLLVLSWGGLAVSIRRDAGRSALPPVAWSAIGLLAVWALDLAWR